MRHLFQYLAIVTSMLFASMAFAQEYTDYIIDENNAKIFCKITQIKKGRVKYKLKGKSYATTRNITKLSDVSFSNPDVLQNPLGIELETPEKGYAHVYFYSSGIPYKVKYNGERLVAIKPGSYFLHQIKSGETHYYTAHAGGVEITAEDQKIYLVRGSESKSNLFNSSPTAELVIDNRKVSEYALLSMKKYAGE